MNSYKHNFYFHSLPLDMNLRKKNYKKFGKRPRKFASRNTEITVLREILNEHE